MKEFKRSIFIKSFWIALMYVGVGTTLLFVKPNESYDILSLIFTLLCLPATFISAAIIYTNGTEAVELILGVQTVMFLIYWYLIYTLFPKRNGFRK